jgi:hypothetical protein
LEKQFVFSNETWTPVSLKKLWERKPEGETRPRKPNDFKDGKPKPQFRPETLNPKLADPNIFRDQTRNDNFASAMGPFLVETGVSLCK